MLKGAAIELAKMPDPSYVIYDDRICDCGEGSLWHPLRQQLYWVDVTNHKILSREDGKPLEIPFKEFVTALAWIDENHLLAATETALQILNLQTGSMTELCALEVDISETRSNDGRADPWGGFWISTMGKDAQDGVGKIYRYYDKELSVIVPSVTIPNAICFDEKRLLAYFADTITQKMYSIELDKKTGAPLGAPSLFKDFSPHNQAIDGAVVDADGNIWVGVWDGKSILCINPEGSIIREIPTGADRPTCPAFGGINHSDLYVTTAGIGLEESFKRVPEQGKTLKFENLVNGKASPRFILPEGFEYSS